jgi:hypothetical protein
MRVSSLGHRHGLEMMKLICSRIFATLCVPSIADDPFFVLASRFNVSRAKPRFGEENLVVYMYYRIRMTHHEVNVVLRFHRYTLCLVGSRSLTPSGH